MSQTIVTPPLTHTVRRALARMWEEPESRSMIIGIIGTILVHLLLLLIGPTLLRNDKAGLAVRPHARPQQFNIQLAPDMYKPPPKPQAVPKNFVETNPEAPDNAPDKSNNFAARAQQVAQEKPQADAHNDRPAMEGQKDLHSTQIVDGRLEKPQEQVPAPPTPVAPTESKLTAPRQEQTPLTGFDKKTGISEGYGSNIANPADAPKDIPNKIDGLKNVPLVEGATDQQPAIDPHHPRARPQIVKTIQSRPAVLTENKIGTSNTGLIGVSAEFSNYGAYLQKMVEIVQAQFDRLNDESRIYPPSGSIVIIKFVINDEGKIARIISVENKATDASARLCTSAITIPSPYGPWTDDMKAMLGKEQELTYEFFYR